MTHRLRRTQAKEKDAQEGDGYGSRRTGCGGNRRSRACRRRRRRGDPDGPKADRATAGAVETTGGGSANAVELDGENGATWEVEVTKEDGTTVDVRLDEATRSL